MKTIFIFVVLLVASLILLNGCSQSEVGITCNKPYILVGTTCCLDQNNNSICDKDESQVNTNTSQENDKTNLEIFAKKLGRAMENNNFGEMYDMINPINKAITRDEFIQLFPLVWGNDAFISVVFNHADIEESPKDWEYLEAMGYVYYDITDAHGYEYKSSAYNFHKVNGSWYFGGFDVSGRGCFNKTYCYEGLQNSTLWYWCPDACYKESLLFLKESKNRFSCDHYLCYCVCWETEEEIVGYHIAP
jgi:hypothetical protein